MELTNASFILSENIMGEMALHELPVGRKAKVRTLLNEGLSRRRLLDLGLIPNTIVKTERFSPAGNPIAFNIKGSIVALRKEETKNVIVQIINE